MNKDVLRNGSGINDYTAYKAIMNTEKGANKMEIEKGEIYEVKRNDGKFMHVVILAVHEQVSSILPLTDEIFENSVKVVCQGEKYTDVHRIQYVFNSNIRRFIRKLTDEEFTGIMDKVAEGLGVSRYVAAPVSDGMEKDVEFYEDKIKALEEEKNCLEDKVNSVQLDLKTIESERDSVIFDLARMKTAEKERNMYKEMYENVMELLVKKTCELKGDK